MFQRLALVLILFTLGCGERKPTGAPPAGGPGADSTLSGGESALPPTIFPHDENWSDPQIHGRWAQENGTRVCLSCHLREGPAEATPPTCASCHPLFPHPANWVRRENHGAWVVANGTESCATQCHGSDFGGGLSQISCGRCHGIFPHRPRWASPEEHGPASEGEGREVCRACHGEDFGGAASGVSCFDCHANYPHPLGWREASAHGPAAYGNNKASCAAGGCHGADFAGGPSAPSCFGCHANFPHTRVGWMNPEQTARAADRNENFHGDAFIRSILRGEMEPCSECHGGGYDRSAGGVQCTVCHTRGITHRTVAGVEWDSGGGHGRFYSNQFSSASANISCQLCHGLGLVFSPDQGRSMLNAQSDCYRCHFAYPHQGWRQGGISTHWGPVVDACGRRTGNNAHVLYVMPGGSPLFTTRGGIRPGNVNDLVNRSAIRNTCAGSETGSCHFNGYRSYQQTEPRNALCTGYCHNPANPSLQPPPERSCPPEPPLICAPPLELCTPEEGDPFCYNPDTEPERCPAW